MENSKLGPSEYIEVIENRILKGDSWTVPYAVVARDTYQGLIDVLEKRHAELNIKRKKKNNPFNPFQPIGVFLTPSGRVLYLSRGVVEDWLLDYVVEKFKGVVEA